MAMVAVDFNRREADVLQFTPDIPERPVKENNKKKGRPSEVYAYDIEEIRAILNYFLENKKYIHHLAFMFESNMARRCGDTLKLKWSDVFNPETGEFRKDLRTIQEEKTDKFASPHINGAVKEAVKMYCENTGCDPSKDNYEVPVFMQLSGTYKGRVITDSGLLKAIKKACVALGIDKNVGTHSARKTFGAMSVDIHPGDNRAMETLQNILNHSDSKTTRRYIGLTKKDADAYYDDMGNFYLKYIMGNEEYQAETNPITHIETADLKAIIQKAYQAGLSNAEEKNPMAHVETITDLLEEVERLRIDK